MFSRIVAVWAFLAVLAAVPAMGAQATLKVNAAQPGPKVSPMLYGIFFEEINHAGDGGIYAELVRNRSFEDADTPQGWSLVTRGSARGTMAIATDQPLNAANRRSLRLEIAQAGEGRVGAANGGYWGIPVRQGAEYMLSFFARCSDEFKGPLAVSLEHAAGLVHAEGKVEGLTKEWKRFQCTLKADSANPAARLVISASSAGTVWLDVVSLFPRDTWKGRPNGLRADLAALLADIKPAFNRFPGGCFVEGDILANAFRWKTTLGDIAERPGHHNLWGYRSTDGLGYHEYLQMCEDIGAEPLFVINCGMAHGGNVPMDQLQPWVQDALDAIEYANGPETSEWGARRAKAGHPAPFNLKYMEIGNENGGPAYEERYARFYDAIKGRHPNMQLVANVAVKSKPMDILDEHYYSSPEWFSANASRYDRYDRKGPRIYVGEYACTQGCGQGNLRAALGEAAFMTGMERNSDIVVMASYAPLFVNVNNRAWNPDAICFNSSASYGTPSYHVQRMFGANRSDVVLPCQLTYESKAAKVSGAIGLGTWITQAEYKDLKVTRGDQTLYAADFAADAKGWKVLKGDWKVQDGAYRQASSETDCRSTAGDPAWADYTYTLKARKLGGGEGFLIMFGVRDKDNWFWWNLGGWGNARHAIEKCTGGGKALLGGEVPGKIEAGRWYDVKIELQGARIRCYLDGKLVHDVEDASPQAMAAVAGRVTATGEIVIKVVNTTGDAQDTAVTLDGAGKVAPEGTALVLTSDDPNDENSFAHPTRVAPVALPAKGLGPSFRYTFPPYSLTILRIQGEKT